MMGRSATTSQRALLRPSQISLPVALISTTNMLSYDAPDLAHAPLRNQQQTQQYMSGAVPRRQASTVSSATSDSSSLRSRHSNASHSTAGTSLSVEGFSPDSPEQNHLTCYFKNQTQPAGTRRADSVVSHASSHASSPHVPSRATSHSIKAHVMSHKRSVSSRTAASPQTPSSVPDSAVVRRDSAEMFSATVAATIPDKSGSAPHPFGKELEQLSEVAEEFSSTVRDVEQNTEMGVLRSKGLGLFCATEYMQEIAPLFSRAYGDDLVASTPAWI